MTSESMHSRLRRSLGGWMVGTLAGVILLAAVLWFGPTTRVWWSAHRYLDAVVARDCAAAARVSVFVTPVGADCTPQSMGFPAELTEYRLSTGRVSWAERKRGETAIGVIVPGATAGYSLHLVLSVSGWVIDSVDVST